jgi:hypothetical protein
MAILGILTNDRERFVARADEKLTAFIELESAIGAATAIATHHTALN